MPAKITRLELIIIVAALVVLVVSNRPPESGNAGVRTDASEIDVETQTPGARTQSGGFQTPQVTRPVTPTAGDLETPRSLAPTSDNLTRDPIPQPQPKRKRLGMVDARNCDSLKYPEVMYGEVTVRWVWDGSKFVPRRVCEVKESNGIVTVWSFDDRHEGLIIKELSPDEVPTE